MWAYSGPLRSYVDGNRALGLAVLASLALHALLFFVLPGLRDSPPDFSAAREPILARLLNIRPSAAPGPAVRELKKKEIQTPSSKPAPRVRMDSVPMASAERPLPASVTPVLPSPAAPVRQSPAAVPVAPSPEPPPSPAASLQARVGAAPSAPPPPEALDAGIVAQYRISLMSAARQFKRYPRAALDNNWQGRVEVRLAVAASGDIASLEVRKSTGHAVLDQQALEMIERAKHAAPIPPALRGREFVVDIPVIFSLLEPGA